MPKRLTALPYKPINGSIGNVESVLANLAGIRRETLNGRQYVVAGVTLISPGVLVGSQGALLYPPDEIAKNQDAWNGVPLVLRHPTRNGLAVSGRDPKVLATQGLGYLYSVNTEDGKLRGEAWLDLESLIRVDADLADNHKLLPRLERGEPVEISTGLFTSNEPSNGTHDGKQYVAIARDYRPDHLAILPDQKGACSVADGCGINNENTEGLVRKILNFLTGNAGKYGNPQSTATGLYKRMGAGTGKGEVHEAAQAGALAVCDRDRELGSLAAVGNTEWVADESKWTKAKTEAAKVYPEGDVNFWPRTAAIYRELGGAVNNQGDDMTRTETISFLVANCDCYEAETLNKLDDAKLAKLKANIDKTKATEAKVKELETVANAATKGVKIGEGTLVFNSQKGKFVVRNADDEECDPDDEECMEMLKKNKKADNAKKPMTDNEWMQSAPPGIQAGVRNAMKITEREKETRIELLLRNVADDRKPSTRAWLSTKPLDELDNMVALQPPIENRDESPFSYIGAAGARDVTANETAGLPLPTWDWSKSA